MNDRYTYLRARAQRITRELDAVIEGCDNILKRLESPLTETFRGKLNVDRDNETKVELLRRRAKDALLHLKDGVQ